MELFSSPTLFLFCVCFQKSSTRLWSSDSTPGSWRPESYCTIGRAAVRKRAPQPRCSERNTRAQRRAKIDTILSLLSRKPRSPASAIVSNQSRTSHPCCYCYSAAACSSCLRPSHVTRLGRLSVHSQADCRKTRRKVDSRLPCFRVDFLFEIGLYRQVCQARNSGIIASPCCQIYLDCLYPLVSTSIGSSMYMQTSKFRLRLLASGFPAERRKSVSAKQVAETVVKDTVDFFKNWLMSVFVGSQVDLHTSKESIWHLLNYLSIWRMVAIDLSVIIKVMLETCLHSSRAKGPVRLGPARNVEMSLYTPAIGL